MTLSDLLVELEKQRSSGKKTAFTNGCFDILHKGHIAYLREAKKLSNILVLGLNSDESVKRLKGQNRPVNNQDDRAFVLSEITSIDYIVIFHEDTPYELLSQIKPDILVKGGDYKVDEVVGREFAQETVLIDFVEGYSTTSIISKMKIS